MSTIEVKRLYSRKYTVAVNEELSQSHGIKVTATDLRYLARCKISRSLVRKKTFGLIRQVVFKLEYLFSQGREDTSIIFEWTPQESRTTIILDNFVNKPYQTLIFVKMFFIGQNSEQVHLTYSLHELLILFWLTQAGIYCLKFDFSLHQRNTERKCLLQRKWRNKNKMTCSFTCLRCWC